MYALAGSYCYVMLTDNEVHEDDEDDVDEESHLDVPSIDPVRAHSIGCDEEEMLRR